MPFYDRYAGFETEVFDLPFDPQLRRLQISLQQELHWMRKVYGQAEKYELLLPVHRAVTEDIFKQGRLMGVPLVFLRDITRPMLAKPLQYREMP